ncbi:MAG: hypothetical protein K0R67_2876 [Paenibacillus sp.]|jgi:fatty-acyl-CoA synthase|nr:hypothetical protein [Paenibacillus sp.]
MITVNTTRYDKMDLEALEQTYQSLDYLAQVENKTYAICFHDPIYTISLVQYFRKNAGSLLLIHGETPLETAVTLAVDAECEALLFGDPKHCIPLLGSLEEPEWEPGICQYSSGTTGAAKLIHRSWSEIQTELDAYNEALDCGETLNPIILAPVSHSYGLLSGVLSALERECEPVIIRNTNPKFAMGIIQATPRHLVYGIPLLFQAISGFAQRSSRFYRFISSGAPMPDSLYRKLSGLTDRMLQQYGCSEVGCISLSNQMEAYSDLGRPLKHVKLRAGSDAASVSEIIVSLGDRTIQTQDLGFISGTGNLRFVTRLDDVINVAGLKVYPLEVEQRIGRLEGVQEVVVYRGRHPVMGEMVKAKIVADHPSITEALVREWCVQGLPPYKIPQQIELTAQIKKPASGKISRRLLEMEEQT